VARPRPAGYPYTPYGLVRFIWQERGGYGRGPKTEKKEKNDRFNPNRQIVSPRKTKGTEIYE